MKHPTNSKTGNRGTARPKRSFGLSRRKALALQSKVAAGQFPNPFSAGFYQYLVAALAKLGVNQSHPRKAVVAEFRKLANAPSTFKSGTGTFWRRWKHKLTSKLWSDRFDQNAEVLQRVMRAGTKNSSPYGQKLIDVGTQLLGTRGVVIDILRGKDGKKFFRLNTDSATPVNDFHNRKENSRKAQVARFRRERMLAQKGRCWICQRKHRRLCVDHCHRHGHLRGLICVRCNSGVGFFQDSQRLLARTMRYLTENEKPVTHESSTEDDQ
jgi:hypothetical protein